MRIPILLLLFINCTFLYGQTTGGNSPADSISEITFKYERVIYNSDRPGSRYIAEILTYSKKDEHRWEPLQFIKVNRSYDSITKKNITDSTQPGLPRSSFTNNDINELLFELNTTRDDFTHAFLKPYLSKISTKDIIKAIAKNDVREDFSRGEITGAEKRQEIRKIKNYYALDTLLEDRKPANDGSILIISHAVHFLWISYRKGEDMISHRIALYEFLGQPFEKHINEKNVSEQHSNWRVNVFLVRHLPRHLLMTKAMGPDKLKEEYLRWYLTVYDRH